MIFNIATHQGQGGMRMDQARIDIFLDEGWCLIDQLHRWSSRTSVESDDRALLIELIRELQKLWAMADDLQLSRLSRTILAIEQFLERICARSLAFNSERFHEVASGIEGLQDLLLGYEATREEPSYANLDSLLRIEQSAQQATGNEDDKPAADMNAIVSVFESARNDSASNSTMIPRADSCGELSISQTPVDPQKVELLDQFTAKLDDTCRRLHARVLADEAPYVTTTSRLEHLAEETRLLAEEMIREARLMRSPPTQPHFENPPHIFTVTAARTASTIEDLSRPPLVLPVEPSVIAAPQLQRLTSITEASSQNVDPPVATVRANGLRILIVEESLFYRHLLGIAVQSAGYEPQIAESVARGLEMLQQTTELSALLVGSTLSPAMVCEIARRRRSSPIKVIGMTLPGHEKVPVPDLDARISKMHPQQLIAVLDKLLFEALEQTRKSA
jgi:chemotaxis protein histidine kinase CheA